jgi:hypothetical protein
MLAQRGTVHEVFEAEVWPAIEKRLPLICNGSVSNQVHIYSHSRYVISQAAVLRNPTLMVKASSFKYLPRSRRFNSVGNGIAVGKMSVGEAVELTKIILAEGGHLSEDRGLPEAHLRPLLSDRDSRAAKRINDLSSVGLIGAVVEDGLNSGWLKRKRRLGRAGSECIWLSEQPGAVSVVPLLSERATPALKEQSTTDVQVVASGDRKVLEINSLAVPPAGEQQAAVVSGGSPVVTSVASSDVTPAAKRKARTKEMISILNQAFFYSPCKIRRYVFSAIGMIKTGGLQKVTVAQFMKDVKDRAMKAAEKDAVEYKSWRATLGAIEEMLLAAKTLIGPGDIPITRGLHARGTQLVSIVDNFEDLSELFLLKTLIQKMQLTSKDRVPIAHALFKEGSEKEYDKLEERLNALFTLMGDELAESEDGRIVLFGSIGTGLNPPRVN